MANSIDANIIEAVKSAASNSGYNVLDTVYDRHNGRFTKSRDAVMVARSGTFDWSEQSYEGIKTEYTLRLRYYIAKTIVQNNLDEASSVSNKCFFLQKALSQVIVGTMMKRFDIAYEEATATNLRGIAIDFTLSVPLSACQDRSEFNSMSDTLQDDALNVLVDDEFNTLIFEAV